MQKVQMYHKATVNSTAISYMKYLEIMGTIFKYLHVEKGSIPFLSQEGISLSSRFQNLRVSCNFSKIKGKICGYVGQKCMLLYKGTGQLNRKEDHKNLT